MSINTKRLTTAILVLHGRGELTKDMLLLADKSPTKFCRKVEQMLLEQPTLKEFNFINADKKEVRVFLDHRWIPILREMYEKSKDQNGIGQMIPVIKCFRYLAGYTRESAVPFTGLDIYQEVAKIKVGSYVGLADSKWALVNNNILNMDVSNLQ